ncbi:MAG: membrane protein insertion efficiency factor YidD [Pseudomonadota bacterium]
MSPWVGGHCRFHPTCSVYAQEVIHSHGIFAGSWLALKRLGRCHPWHPGGFDPPPNINNVVDP